MKYYCEECKAWETRELFEAILHESSSSLSSPASALRSWGCVKLIHHGSFQTFRVAELNVDAEGRDAAGTLKLDFPSIESPAATQPPPGQLEVRSTATTARVFSLRFIYCISFSRIWKLRFFLFDLFFPEERKVHVGYSLLEPIMSDNL